MPAITYTAVYDDMFSAIEGFVSDQLPGSPYAEIIESLDLSDFDKKLITYIEITRAFMAEMTTDVEARRLRTVSAKMMAAMSESSGTYASVAVPPIVGIPNLAALTDTDTIKMFAIGSYDDFFDIEIQYDLESLGGEGGPIAPPTTIDELVTILNDLIETQGGDGYGNFFEFFNAGNGLIGVRPGEATISRGMNLVISDTGVDGTTSLLTKLGMVAGSSDNAIRVRANDAVQRALAPYLTALRYLPPPEEGGGGG